MKAKAFLRWLLVMLILDSVFIIPMTIFTNRSLSLFLSIIWGTIIGIMCLPLWQRFINIKTIKLESAEFNPSCLKESVGWNKNKARAINELVEINNSKGKLKYQPIKMSQRCEPMVFIDFNQVLTATQVIDKEFTIDKDKFPIPDGSLLVVSYTTDDNVEDDEMRDIDSIYSLKSQIMLCSQNIDEQKLIEVTKSLQNEYGLSAQLILKILLEFKKRGL